MQSQKLITDRRERQSLRTWLELMRCAKTIEMRLSTNLRRDFGQSFSRFDVLAQLYRANDRTLPVTALASSLLASASKNITGLIDRMAEDDLVERQPHPADRRSFIVQLTGKGASLFEQMAEQHSRWVSDGFDGLSGSALKSMHVSLTALRKHLEQAK
jgi:DNA-binding MarR family transcriptional regulator